MAKDDAWRVWLDNGSGPTSTQKLSKVEHRVLDNRTWWSDHRSDVQEWAELSLVRIVIAVAGVFFLGVASVLAPLPRLECLRIVKTHDASDWKLRCEYADSSVLQQRSDR